VKISITDLSLDPKNARKHSARNLEAIAASLEKFGQRKPIVVHRGVVLAGNGTLEAAKSLGWTEIDVAEVPDDWDSETAKAYALADNRSAELAEWDESELAKQLLELQDADWNIEELGFEVPALSDIDGDKDEDEVPEPPVEPVTKLGQIWQLGRHRLMCGDSTDEATVQKLMGGAKADMVFTDPPYGVSYTGGIQFKNGKVEKNNQKMIKNDDIDIYEDVMRILSKFSEGPCYIWFADTKAAKLYEAAEKYGNIHALLIWVKNGGYGALNANYKQKHEPCLYWKPKGKTLNFSGATTETTIWEIDKDGKNKLHPTQKPVALASKAIGNHNAKTVLDIFGGSGSTLIASEQLNRTAYVMELDPKYCDVIVTRWENLTGLKAELVNVSN
jgi:site-specific DNA-methyltransferase (adenine-specific)